MRTRPTYARIHDRYVGRVLRTAKAMGRRPGIDQYVVGRVLRTATAMGRRPGIDQMLPRSSRSDHTSDPSRGYSSGLLTSPARTGFAMM